MTVVQQAIFDKPVKHRHLKALYMKGFVDGKSINKMLVDGGASINLVPYATFHKLGKGPGDLLETNMMLRDFGGNTSKTRGAINVELTIGSKTLLPKHWIGCHDTHRLISANHLDIISMPLNQTLMHGRCHTTVCVNPVMTEE